MFGVTLGVRVAFASVLMFLGGCTAATTPARPAAETAKAITSQPTGDEGRFVAEATAHCEVHRDGAKTPERRVSLVRQPTPSGKFATHTLPVLRAELEEGLVATVGVASGYGRDYVRLALERGERIVAQTELAIAVTLYHDLKGNRYDEILAGLAPNTHAVTLDAHDGRQRYRCVLETRRMRSR
jgi:hypothetical protein